MMVLVRVSSSVAERGHCGPERSLGDRGWDDVMP